MNYKEVFKEDEIAEIPLGKLVLVTLEVDEDRMDEVPEVSICEYCFFSGVCEGDRDFMGALGLDCGDDGFFILEK